MKKVVIRRSAFALVAAGFAALPALALAEEVIAVTADNRLIKFDSATPGTITSATAITGVIGSIVGIDVRPETGTLYAVTDGARLYRINPTTGAATVLGTNPFTTSLGANAGVDFNPVVDRLRIVTDTNRNMRVNPNNASLVDGDGVLPDVQEDGALAYAALDPNFGVDPMVVAVAYSNNTGTAATTTLFGIDSGTNSLVTINPPNAGTLTTTGALTVDPTELLGFDISGTSTTGFAVMNVVGQPASQLYSINLVTGAATLVGTVGDVHPIKAITIGPASAPPAFPTNAMVAVNSAGELIKFAANAPETITQRTAVTGLELGDQLVALDRRSAGGRLYALGLQGRIYLVNSTTGAATAVRTAVFEVPLGGTEFGFDFNPTVDRIRIVSNTGANFRVDPETGAVVDGDAVTPGVQGDTALDYAATDPNDAQTPDIVAVAYDRTDSTTATTLFGLDAALNNLVRIGGVDGLPDSPNAGQVRTIGNLGVDFTSVGSFEIADADKALASLVLATGTSQLFSVDLVTGIATLVGPVGASETVRGLSEVPTAEPAPPGELNVVALGMAFDFRCTDRDKAVLDAFVTAPTGSLSGLAVRVDIGGYEQAFTLDSRGKATLDEGTRSKADDETFRFVGKPKNGLQKFRAVIARENIHAFLQDENMAGNANANKEDRTIRVAITINGVTVTDFVSLDYTARANVTGFAKIDRD